MLYEEALNRVKKCIHNTLGDDRPLYPHTTLGELTLDSLDTLDLAYHLEEEFGVSHLDTTDFSGVTDLDQVTKCVMQLPPRAKERSYGT